MQILWDMDSKDKFLLALLTFVLWKQEEAEVLCIRKLLLWEEEGRGYMFSPIKHLPFSLTYSLPYSVSLLPTTSRGSELACRSLQENPDSEVISHPSDSHVLVSLYIFSDHICHPPPIPETLHWNSQAVTSNLFLSPLALIEPGFSEDTASLWTLASFGYFSSRTFYHLAWR